MSAILVAGVDGGGTKTLIVLADAAGHELGRGQAAGCNYQAVGVEAARAALAEALAGAFRSAGIPQVPLDGLCLGLAGIGRAEDRGWVDEWIREANLARRWQVANDSQLLLAAGTPHGWGVGLISGTGSIAHGRSPDGREARSGGWGYLLGDEGSGYALGRSALQAIAQAADGRGPATALTRRVLEAWGLAQPEDLVGKVYRSGIGRVEIAALAGLVLSAAQEGDPVARELQAQAARDLAQMVAAVARRLDLNGSIPAAFGGGVLTHGGSLAGGVVEAALRSGLKLEPVELVTEPVVGAVRLGLRLLVSGYSVS